MRSPKIVLTHKDRQEIAQWEQLEGILRGSQEASLVLSEGKLHIESHKLPIIKARPSEIVVFTDWYRQGELLGLDSDDGTQRFIKNNYSKLTELFTIQRLQLILNWYHVYDPALMVKPSQKILEMVPDLLIKLITQESWDCVFTLIGGLYYLSDLEGEEEAIIPNVHRRFYTLFRKEIEAKFLKDLEENKEVQEKFLKGEGVIPYELEGIVSYTRIYNLLLKPSPNNSEVV